MSSCYVWIWKYPTLQTSGNSREETGTKKVVEVLGMNRREFLQLCGAGAAVVVLSKFSSPLFTKTEAQVSPWTLTNPVTTNPVHVVLLHTGKILYYGGSGWHYGRQNGPYEGRVLDYNTGVESTVTTSEDGFCCGQTTLADGTILFAGGTELYDQNPDNCNGDWHGLNATFEFNPTTETFTKTQNMLHGRWYPTLVTLPDGRVWCYNGYDEYGVNNTLTERYDPSTNTWTRIPATGTLTYKVGGTQNCGDVTPSYSGAGPTTSFYPRAHVMPSGLLMIVGFRPEVRSWNPATGVWATLGNSGITRHYGTSFLLPLQNTTTEKGKILLCGGSSVSTGPSTTQAQILDFNTGNPTIRTVASSAFARKYMCPVLLPNGKCVIFGGTAQTNINPVLTPEQFDPITETWQSLPASTIARHYHSTALLLPDGRVWVTGGNVNSGVWELRTEIFSPSYISQTRPTITAAPTVGAYGGTITISTPSPTTVTSVSMLRLMNTTHHYDANQRLIWLQIQSRGTNSVIVSAPISSNIAPPGYYLIHVLNSSLIPSIGRIIKIPGTAAPPADTTPPTLAITSPANGTTFPPGNVTISGTASDTGGSGLRDVRVRVDSGSYLTATLTGNTWSRVVSITATGLHRITANARDIANNFVTKGIDVNIGSGTADTTPPNVAITSPATGATVSSPITVTGTASDNIGIRDVRVRIDAGSYLTATGTTNWSISIAAATGSRKITVNARDAAGNYRLASVTVNVT
jgi:hypothetical protein